MLQIAPCCHSGLVYCHIFSILSSAWGFKIHPLLPVSYSFFPGASDFGPSILIMRIGVWAGIGLKGFNKISAAMNVRGSVGIGLRVAVDSCVES